MPSGRLTLFDEPGAIPALGLLSSGLGLLSGQGAGQGINSVINALISQQYNDVLQGKQAEEQAAAERLQQQRSRLTGEISRLGLDKIPPQSLIGSGIPEFVELGQTLARENIEASRPGEFTKLAMEAAKARESTDPLARAGFFSKIGVIPTEGGEFVSTAAAQLRQQQAEQAAIDRREAARLAQSERESVRLTGSIGNVQSAIEYDQTLAAQGISPDSPERLNLRSQIEKTSGLAQQKEDAGKAELGRKRAFEASSNIYKIAGELEEIADKHPGKVAGIGKSVAKILEIATSLRDPNAPTKALPGTATESTLARLLTALQLGMQTSGSGGQAGRLSNQEQDRLLQSVGDKLMSGNASLLREGIDQVKELTRIYIEPEVKKTIVPNQGARAEDFLIP